MYMRDNIRTKLCAAGCRAEARRQNKKLRSGKIKKTGFLRYYISG
jgi:hypothetical protein